MKKILLYGIDEEVLKILLSILKNTTDKIHLVKNDELEEVLFNLLEREENIEFEEPKYNMSLCLFAGYQREEVFNIIDDIKRYKIKRPVFAMVTKQNINWKIGRILVDTNQDHIEMNKKG